MIVTLNVHDAVNMKANAHGEDGGTSWISITAQGKNDSWHEITFFMPYDAAKAYANAINTCNDREAASQAVARQRDYLPELTQTLGEY